MITVKRKSAAYAGSIKECNRQWMKDNPNESKTPIFSKWLDQYGGRLVIGWDIEFDDDEDAIAFILKFS